MHAFGQSYNHACRQTRNHACSLSCMHTCMHAHAHACMRTSTHAHADLCTHRHVGGSYRHAIHHMRHNHCIIQCRAHPGDTCKQVSVIQNKTGQDIAQLPTTSHCTTTRCKQMQTRAGMPVYRAHANHTPSINTYQQ